MSEHSAEKSRQVAESARQREWTQPSFGKELFMGRLRLDLIHPYPRPRPDEVEKGEAFLGRLADFLDSVDPLQIERDSKIPDQVIEGLAKLGAFGMNIAEEYGGVGLSQVYYNRALQLANSAHASLGALLSAHQSIGVPKPIKLFGTDEQKHRFLPRLAAGEVSAFALTEPDVGSDPARMHATAVPTEDGSAYILNGTKLWTTNGTIARLLIVMAVVPESEGHKGGISAFVVESHMKGYKVLRRNSFMGLRGIENAVLEFKDVRVPKDNLIGKEGDGLKIALVTLNTGRLSLPATNLTAAKACLRIVRNWANEREQWGRPIGKHDAIAQLLADITASTFGMEAVVELSGALADQERNDIRLEAALAKLWVTETVWRTADQTMQVRGGRGYETAESLKARGEQPIPTEQIMRDLRVSRIFEGSTEIMRLFIAREAVDRHLEVGADLIDPKSDLKKKTRAAAGAAGFYARWLPSLAVGKGRVPTTYRGFGKLSPHLRYAERNARKLARSIFYGMSRYGPKLEFKQAFLGRLVDIGAELYAISATCVYARMLVEDDRSDNAYELADLFCRQSRRRIETLFDALWHNEDDRNYRTAQRMLEGEYRWLEDGIVESWGEMPPIAEPPSQPPPLRRAG
ncbi:MAG TPA: acyl-CoA dehydrogenase family protein [Candidatus Dormibacteraeota bacterium]